MINECLPYFIGLGNWENVFPSACEVTSWKAVCSAACTSEMQPGTHFSRKQEKWGKQGMFSNVSYRKTEI